MMEAMRYYTLKFLSGNTYHHKGDVLKTASETLTIGEGADCDVRYEAPADCDDEQYYAIIKRTSDADCQWVLIRQSPLVKVTIAGKEEFQYMSPLHDGDIIEFEGQKMPLRFSMHHDTNYSEAGTTIYKDSTNKRVIYSLFTLIAIALIGIGSYVCANRPKAINNNEVAYMTDCIFRLDVDSVEYCEIINGKESCLNVKSFEDEGKPSGTAFLTSDNLLVTARHCVEYWLGDRVPMSVGEIDQMDKDDIRRWAAEVETYNYTHQNGDTLLALRCYCTLYDENNDRICSFSSSSIDNQYIDRNRDEIITIDDFDKIYYWRTITPYFENRSMEVGDIFCMPLENTGRESKIELADAKCVQNLEAGDPLFFYGYSETEKDNHNIKFEDGVIKEDFKDRGNGMNHNIIHSGNLNHGFSGGPVITRKPRGMGFVIVGVISKCDSVNRDLQMSVPVTAMKKGGKR